jgi:hypothetical protein
MLDILHKENLPAVIRFFPAIWPGGGCKSAV